MQGEGGVNQSRRAAVLLVIAVFVLGIALGVLGTYMEGYRVFGSGMLHRTPPDHSPAAQQRGRQAKVDRFTKELSLTADQQRQLDSVLAQMQTRYSGVHEQSRAQMDQVHKQGSDAIRAILTPEQAAKFDDMLRKMDEERKKAQGNN
jgi:Spy/CpxP family protein refolding chaperone